MTKNNENDRAESICCDSLFPGRSTLAFCRSFFTGVTCYFLSPNQTRREREWEELGEEVSYDQSWENMVLQQEKRHWF